MFFKTLICLCVRTLNNDSMLARQNLPNTDGEILVMYNLWFLFMRNNSNNSWHVLRVLVRSNLYSYFTHSGINSVVYIFQCGESFNIFNFNSFSSLLEVPGLCRIMLNNSPQTRKFTFKLLFSFYHKDSLNQDKDS